MAAVPINLTNAIDAVAFVIVFDRTFTEKEENKLLKLQEDLKKDLPLFSQDVLIGTKIENEIIVTQDVKKSGIKLQKIEPNGKIGWSLHILGNQIIITCKSYDRWDKVWTKVEKYLNNTVKLLELKDLSVSAVVLQYIDRFTESASGKYKLENVFSKETEYLTQHTKNVGKLWHVHQGWFETGVSAKEKVLHVLNLGTTEHLKKILTTIDHALQLQFIEKPKNAKEFFDSKKEYKKVFDSLHRKNKDIIKSLLNNSLRKAIGLV